MPFTAGELSSLLAQQMQQTKADIYSQQAMQNMAYSGYYGTITTSCTDASQIAPLGWSGAPEPKPEVKQEKRSVFSEIAKDIKTFILEHRAVIYFLALALIVDHLIFKDAFRERLKSIVESIIKKVETKVNA